MASKVKKKTLAAMVYTIMCHSGVIIEKRSWLYTIVDKVGKKLSLSFSWFCTSTHTM